jgi:hypothetical protein
MFAGLRLRCTAPMLVCLRSALGTTRAARSSSSTGRASKNAPASATASCGVRSIVRCRRCTKRAADLVALGLRHLGLCRRPERPENKVRANLPGRAEGGSNACATHASVAPPCSAAFSLPPVPRCHAPVRRAAGAGAGVAYVRVPELRPLGKSHELHWQVSGQFARRHRRASKAHYRAAG